MRKIVFELCSESIDACLQAKLGGANRIELCSALSEGGLTPSHGLVAEAVAQSGLPVHVLLRPRAGDFVYSDAEFQVMKKDLKHAVDMGASGVVLGILKPDHRVDVKRMQAMVAMAEPLEVTFHRAFDEVASLEEALESVILSGCHRVLTSGGKQTVEAGAESLSFLVQQAASRIEIAVGGGLRLQNAAAVARITGATHFHGSVQRQSGVEVLAEQKGRIFESSGTNGRSTVFADDIRRIIRNLTEA